MKSLFVVLTGMEGESYVRLYVWTEDEYEARRIAWKVLMRDTSHKPCRLENRDKLIVHKLFDANEHEFATLPSDSGFALPGKDLEN